MAVNRGFAEISPMKATIIADTAESAEEIDLARARAARTRSEERLKTLPKNDPAYQQELDALERAKIRIQVGEKAVRS
jgi:F-type H+-transporting ATPase subunit epsilon